MLGIQGNPPTNYLGVKAADPATGLAGQFYYNSGSNSFKFYNGSAWSALGGSSGLAMGTTTSDGTANTVLKTDGSGKANDATGVTQPANTTLKLTAQAAGDRMLNLTYAASPTGDAITAFRSDGTTKAFWVDAPSSSHSPILRLSESNFNNQLQLTVDNSGQANMSVSLANQKIVLGGRPQTGTGHLWVMGREDDTGGTAVEIRTIAVDNIGLKFALPASPTANVFEINSNGGSGGDLFKISANGVHRGHGHRVTASSPTNNTTTFSSLSDLTVNVQAGKKYIGYVGYWANDSTGAEGIKFDFNGGSATMTLFEASFQATPIGATLGTTQGTSISTALTATAVATSDSFFMIPFTMTVNAAGTFIPRFAQNSHTSGTATIKQGSYIFLVETN